MKKNIQLVIPMQAYGDSDVPKYDIFDGKDLHNIDDLEEVLDCLVADLKSDYFFLWETVFCDELGCQLTKKQEKAFDALIDSGKEEDERILFVDGMPRPVEPWYAIVKKIAPHLLMSEPFRTDIDAYEVMLEGWRTLSSTLEKRSKRLSLPEHANSYLDIIPLELRYRLELQICLYELHGIGGEDLGEVITLENVEEQQRIAFFVDYLRDYKNSVRFLELTLDNIFTRVTMPAKDEAIFLARIMSDLGMTSTQDQLIDYL